MAALPYIQLYVADYLADTAHLTASQHGGYLLLIFNYWQRGHPLNNFNERLTNVARMSNDEWKTNKPVLAEFFQIDGDIWNHARIDADLAQVASKSTKASVSGKASAAKRALKLQRSSNSRSTNVKRSFNQADTDTEAYTELKRAEQPAATPPTFWDVGVGMGIPRALIGKWIKQTTEIKTSECIAAMAIKRPADPRQWGTAWLQERPKKLYVPDDDDSLEPFADDNNLPKPAQTETYKQYRARLWGLVKGRVGP